MTTQVQKILSFYESDNPGVLNQLARILNHGTLAGTGRMVILPVDQGFEHGPMQSFGHNPEAYDPHYHFKLALASGCNAYAAPLGFLQAGAREFAGAIPLILKLNHSDRLYTDSESPLSATTASVEQALQLGCVAVGFTIYPGSKQCNQMYEKIAQLSEYAKKQGLAVVIWSYPRGKNLSKKEETALDVVAYAAHIAAQLGAHIIKVKPPSSVIKADKIRDDFKNNPAEIHDLSDRVRYVLQSTFNGRRIVIFSGGQSKEKNEFIQEIKELSKGGAFGSIVGRNAFQRPFKESVTLLKEVMDIYKKQSSIHS